MTPGQVTPDDGQVVFDGQDVTRAPMYRRARLGMGYLSQEQSIFKKLSVEQNILAILEALPKNRLLGRALTRSERRARTDEALQRFNLSHVRSNAAARCSGGEKRRLEIARCLVCDPLLILMDEPFAAVDPKTTEDIRKNIRELASTGIGILMTDHNVREVLRIADRIYLIVNGRVVTEGTPQELVRDQVAIDAYLGNSFEDDGLPGALRISPSTDTPPPMPAVRVDPKPSIQRILESIPVPAVEPTPPPPERTEPIPAPDPVPVPQSFRGGVKQLLEEELIRRNVELLKDRASLPTAWQELVAKGTAAVPVLLETLERREVELRHLAFRLLQTITKEPLQFQADAPDDVRLRQVAFLRLTLDPRRS
jgi:lipopolysaccharide export system ATP-binding protein